MKVQRLFFLTLFVSITSAACFPQENSSFGQDNSVYKKEHKSTEEWEKRVNKRQQPSVVMDTIGVKPGMVIGEIGAGRGRYTVHLADRVGSKGKIYANDIDKGGLNYIKDRCEANNINNIEIILGEMNDPCFPENSLDMAFMVWVYHGIYDPVPLLKKLKKSLKPGALLIMLEPVDEEIEEEGGHQFGDNPTLPKMKERAIKEGGKAGYELIKVDDFLEMDRIYYLRVK
ncbi:class I SAM-dependent methyltransferase [Bacteroidota bacterium]